MNINFSKIFKHINIPPLGRAWVGLVFLPLSLFAQPKWNQAYQSYIDKYKGVAIDQMHRYNIPASITLAQGLLESGAGRSTLARQSNNHFGIKCHGWTGRKTYHDDDASQECFRAYNNPAESYEDHSLFLRSGQRYAFLFKLDRTDYKGWAHGLKRAGYATNPQYAYSLIGIIETYNLAYYDRVGRHTQISAPTIEYSYQIHMCNGIYYVLANEGDTFKKIGKEMGVSARKLAKYNERHKKDVLSKGDIVYLDKKKKRADKRLKGKYHTIKPGESLYTISQMYGIRLSSLYKKNHLPDNYTPQVGDQLKVY